MARAVERKEQTNLSHLGDNSKEPVRVVEGWSKIAETGCKIDEMDATSFLN